MTHVRDRLLRACRCRHTASGSRVVRRPIAFPSRVVVHTGWARRRSLKTPFSIHHRQCTKACVMTCGVCTHNRRSSGRYARCRPSSGSASNVRRRFCVSRRSRMFIHKRYVACTCAMMRIHRLVLKTLSWLDYTLHTEHTHTRMRKYMSLHKQGKPLQTELQRHMERLLGSRPSFLAEPQPVPATAPHSPRGAPYEERNESTTPSTYTSPLAEALKAANRTRREVMRHIPTGAPNRPDHDRTVEASREGRAPMRIVSVGADSYMGVGTLERNKKRALYRAARRSRRREKLQQQQP